MSMTISMHKTNLFGLVTDSVSGERWYMHAKVGLLLRL